MSRVTICIPTYNRAHFLIEAIQSVLAQTVTDFEVLVSDNASTDSTRDVVSSFSDERILYQCQGRNIGLLGNLKSVIELAVSRSVSEYIAILSDDDRFLPHHLSTAMESLALFPRATYYSGPAERFGDGVSGILTLGARSMVGLDRELRYFAPRDAVTFLGIDTPGPLITMVCRTKAFKHDLYWGRPDYIPVDLILMTQLMVQDGFVLGNRITAQYRTHGGNVSHTAHDRLTVMRVSCMEWYGIRWLAQYLLDQGLCTPNDIKEHGINAKSADHVVSLVISLGSFDSPSRLRAVAKRVFYYRSDMDTYSARFRLARRFGFIVLPLSEKISQARCGWRP